jgi:hypothetical protein
MSSKFNHAKGCGMYCLLKKMKSLKSSLNKLNWKNGNLFEKVKV